MAVRKRKTYKACKEGQVRNPKTNRCKKVNLYSHSCVHLDTTLRVVIGKDNACVKMNINGAKTKKNEKYTLKRQYQLTSKKHKMANPIEQYTFTDEDLMNLGLELPETTKEFANIMANLSPTERAEIENEIAQTRRDIETIQKFTGNKETKTEKARKWLYEMYA